MLTSRRGSYPSLFHLKDEQNHKVTSHQKWKHFRQDNFNDHLIMPKWSWKWCLCHPIQFALESSFIGTLYCATAWPLLIWSLKEYVVKQYPTETIYVVLMYMHTICTCIKYFCSTMYCMHFSGWSIYKCTLLIVITSGEKYLLLPSLCSVNIR